MMQLEKPQGSDIMLLTIQHNNQPCIGLFSVRSPHRNTWSSIFYTPMILQMHYWLLVGTLFINIGNIY